MKRLTPLVCLFAFLLVPAGALADEIFSIKVGLINLTPSGQFASRDGVINTTIDIEDDLDISDSSEIIVEAGLNLASFHLSASYMPLNFTGTSTLRRDITFGGRTFTVNETVDGELNVDLFDIGLTWYILNFDDLPVRLQLGPELAVKVVDGETSVSSRTIPDLRESVSGTAPVPTIGARGRIGFSDFVAATGRIGFIGFSGNSFLDADVQVEFSPIPLLGLFAGYRYLDLEVDESDIFIDATFDGPYGGAFVRF